MSAEIKPITPPTSEQIDQTDSAIRMLANDLHRLNQSVVRAVEAGVSVELIRSSRHHNGEGNWGDLMVPVITKS
ncbi:hypothetical protein GCM10007939_18580 [Amylibacter marinus]|uniref:Methyl-accepting chemotaxis protein n=1 Tax=Amylibacter marinus TaxID=1475483 RepID=A0ABQ5VWC4_9RHOB|nr:hypothetical protein [Amylibacter marinus]GLQ35575.1 hypothetical protein GCM10007939_18580 [Amylibacter marinus]